MLEMNQNFSKVHRSWLVSWCLMAPSPQIGHGRLTWYT